jgi:hypothetical protein
MRTAVIYEGVHGVRVDRPDVTIVGSPREDLVAVARALATGGADRVELCGGLGVADHAEVATALGSEVAVGLNRYAFESLELIADYKVAFAAGDERPGAFIYLSSGADPARDRVEHAGTTFVAVPDEDLVAAVATEVAAAGARLIELYAGLGTTAAARVLAATDGRVPVGVTGYGEPPDRC